MQLRPYQQLAVDAVYDHLRTRDDHPCVVIPTAGGKTPVMATICKDAVGQWNGRVLILAHVKELLEQTADKLNTICPEVEYGMYSASLKRRDTSHSVIVAGIQSVYKRACELDRFDLILVDEAHLIPLEGEGMYRQFLADAQVLNPDVRIVGFTATPFRLKTGPICTPESFLNAICYEVGVRELIVDGYLSSLITKAGINNADFGQLPIRGGEFVADEMECLMDDDQLVESACQEVIGYSQDRHGVLIFASGIHHGQHIAGVLSAKHNVECGFVSGETPTKDRDAILGRFRRRELKYLCNVNVLTTGFDAPHIDCVAILRPTMSPGLYYQMVGRGFRLHPGKENCLVLDFGGNVLRHGPVDNLQSTTYDGENSDAPAKVCPVCHTVIAAGCMTCPDCGYVFPPPEQRQHAAKAGDANILSAPVTATQYRVQETYYSVHTKRGASESAPKTMRVDYRVGWHQYKSEWVCFEHHGYARQKAIGWWRRHSPDSVPSTAQRAVEIAQGGGVAATLGITVRAVAGEEFEQITDYELGSLPEPVTADSLSGYDPDEIPF